MVPSIAMYLEKFYQTSVIFYKQLNDETVVFQTAQLSLSHWFALNLIV